MMNGSLAKTRKIWKATVHDSTPVVYFVRVRGIAEGKSGLLNEREAWRRL
jgi:hypothetical protein